MEKKFETGLVRVYFYRCLKLEKVYTKPVKLWRCVEHFGKEKSRNFLTGYAAIQLMNISLNLGKRFFNLRSFIETSPVLKQDAYRSHLSDLSLFKSNLALNGQLTSSAQ